MRRILLILPILAFAACGPQTPLDANTGLVYFKDARTRLCFAQIESITKDGWAVHSIANVPCSDEVESLVKQGAEK